MPDKRATLRTNDSVRKDIGRALAGRQPQMTMVTPSAEVIARKGLANQIAKQNQLFKPLGQAAKGTLWRGPDKPVNPMFAKKPYRPI